MNSEQVEHAPDRLIDLFGLDSPLVRRWTGVRDEGKD